MELLALTGLYLASVVARRLPYDPAIENGVFGSYPVHSFVTESEFKTPKVNWLQTDPACDDDLFTFLTPRGHAVRSPGPMILDNDGELVWSYLGDSAFHGQAYDLKVQQYRGESFLTFWLGDDLVQGHGSGTYYMLNASYDVVHSINALDGLDADLHEFLIPPDGVALITAYEKRLIDNDALLSGYDGRRVDDARSLVVWDGILQAIDLRTGTLLFEWRASDHIAVTETYQLSDREGTYDRPWDCYHINSIDKDQIGNYLVSARYTNSIIYIDGRTGEIIWRLGGRKNDFHDLDDTSLLFAGQHDARFHDAISTSKSLIVASRNSCEVRLISLFDNGRDDRPSRGVLLEMTYPSPSTGDPGNRSAYTVRTIREYSSSSNLRSSSQGSMQIIMNHTKVLLGYGYNPVWTEFDSNGTILCNAHFGSQVSWESGDVQSYRVRKHAWIGTPHTPPKLGQSSDGLFFFASWNGATEVKTWVLQATEQANTSREHWREVYRRAKQGFETVLAPSPTSLQRHRFLRVLALDQDGLTLPHGISRRLDRGEIEVVPVSWIEGPMNEAGAAQSFRGIAYAAVVLIMVVLSCQLLRRWRMHRHGRASGSPYRWKSNTVHRMLNGEA